MLVRRYNNNFVATKTKFVQLLVININRSFFAKCDEFNKFIPFRFRWVIRIYFIYYNAGFGYEPVKLKQKQNFQIHIKIAGTTNLTSLFLRRSIRSRIDAQVFVLWNLFLVATASFTNQSGRGLVMRKSIRAQSCKI